MANIEIFTGSQCAYCEQAKKLLNQNKLTFTEYNISQSEHMAEFSARLPRIRSIPQIFVDGEHIGNEEDLRLLIQNGRFNA